MNTNEAMTFLVKAGALDPTMLPADRGDRMVKAAAWAEMLAAVPLRDAVTILNRWYRQNTRSITVADVYAAHVSEAEADGIPVAPCNPLIIDARHDPEGRYCVTCRACGYQRDVFCTTLEAAEAARDTHERHQVKWDQVEAGDDWSESRLTQGLALMPTDGYWDERGEDRPSELTVACPWCKAEPFEKCQTRGTDEPLTGFHPARTDAAGTVDLRDGA